jgi:hypothetical protein
MVRLVLNGKQRSDCSQARHGNYSFHVRMSSRSPNSLFFSFLVIFLAPGFHDRLQSNANRAWHMSCSFLQLTLNAKKAVTNLVSSAPAGRIKYLDPHGSSDGCTSALKPRQTDFPLRDITEYQVLFLTIGVSLVPRLPLVTFRRRGPSAFDLWLNTSLVWFVDSTWWMFWVSSPHTPPHFPT